MCPGVSYYTAASRMLLHVVIRILPNNYPHTPPTSLPTSSNRQTAPQPLPNLLPPPVPPLPPACPYSPAATSLPRLRSHPYPSSPASLRRLLRICQKSRCVFFILLLLLLTCFSSPLDHVGIRTKDREGAPCPSPFSSPRKDSRLAASVALVCVGWQCRWEAKALLAGVSGKICEGVCVHGHGDRQRAGSTGTRPRGPQRGV